MTVTIAQLITTLTTFPQALQMFSNMKPDRKKTSCNVTFVLCSLCSEEKTKLIVWLGARKHQERRCKEGRGIVTDKGGREDRRVMSSGWD